MKDVTLLFATFLASADYKTYHYVTEYVERFTGIPTLLLNGEDLDDFAAGYVDAGFVAASDYAYLSNLIPNPVERIARPMLQGGIVQHEQSAYEGERFRVVVRRESPYYELNDLERSLFSYCFRGYCPVEEAAYGQTLEQVLYAANSSLVTVAMGGTIETATPMQALRLVVGGQVEAAVVEERVLNLVLRNSGMLANRVRLLGNESGPKASDVVVASRLDDRVKQAIREAFRTIHQEPFFAQRLRASAIEQFQVVEVGQALPVTAGQPEQVASAIYEQEQAYAFHW